MIGLQSDKHFLSSILSEITWTVLSIFFPYIRIWDGLIYHPLEFFHFFFNIRFQKCLGFLLIFLQISYIEAVKKRVQHLTIFGCFRGFCCTNKLENFSYSFIQNRYGKFKVIFDSNEGTRTGYEGLSRFSLFHFKRMEVPNPELRMVSLTVFNKWEGLTKSKFVSILKDVEGFIG